MSWINTIIDILLVIYVLDCAFMGLVIMMQRSKQEGLGAAFGSGIMSDTFGAGASKALVKATVWAAAIFFIISVSLARLYSNRAAMDQRGSPVQQELLKPVTVPAGTNAAPAVPASTSTTPAPVPPASTTSAPASANAAPIAPAKPESAASSKPASGSPAKPATK